jgi:hypothetical protein
MKKINHQRRQNKIIKMEAMLRLFPSKPVKAWLTDHQTCVTRNAIACSKAPHRLERRPFSRRQPMTGRFMNTLLS